MKGTAGEHLPLCNLLKKRKAAIATSPLARKGSPCLQEFWPFSYMEKSFS
jgi:hypothetical protein